MRNMSERGTFAQEPSVFGKTSSGFPLEVWLPAETNISQVDILVIGGVHSGTEPESVTLLSKAFRSILPESLRCAVIVNMNPESAFRGTRGNSNGVDLNRNFPTSDWQSEPLLYKWHYTHERQVKIGSGDHAASEPETKALLNLISEMQPTAIVPIHAPAACIDDPDNTRIGRWLSEQTNLPHLLDWDISTPGSLGTWGKENGLPIITYELPAESLRQLREVHEPALVGLLKGVVSL